MASRPGHVLLAALAAAALLCPSAVSAAGKSDARLQIAQRREQAKRRALGAGAPEAAYSVILSVAPGTTLQELRAAHPGVRFGSQSGPVVTARVPESALAALEGDARVASIHGARKFVPTMNVVRSSTIYAGSYLGTTINSPTLDLANVDGTNVIVGVVDTGIDYTHADFIAAGNTSRVLSIWDQTISSDATGTFPPGFTYGAYYTQAQLTSKIQGGGITIRTQDTEGHGTHVTGIAASNGNGGNGTLPAGTFTGMAPKADIIMVKTNFSDAGIIDGVNYISQRAAAAGKKAVINLSLGNMLDPHDGTSNIDVGIDAVAANTPVVVAMGNDGDANPHANTTGMSFNQTVSFTVSVTNGYSTDAEVNLWGPSSDSYSMTVTLSGFTCPGMTAASGVHTSTTTPLTCGGNEVYIFNASAGTGSNSPSDREMYVDVFNGGGLTIPSLTVAVTCTNPSGCSRLDGWVFPSAEGTAMVPGPFLSVTQAYSMAAPATASNVIAVGAYATKASWTDLAGAQITYGSPPTLGQIASFSAWGPTRDGRQKPDVAAPGFGIGSTKSTWATFDSRTILQDNLHVIDQGTSMATPVVTGIIATRLQGFPSRTVSQIKTILQGAARADAAVTSYGSVPNPTFGYGKVTSSPQPQAAPSGVSATSLGTSSITWNWSGNTISADAYDVYLATKATQSLALAIQPPYIQTGLLANATYGIALKGEGGGVDGPAAFITTATYAAAPGSLPSATGFSSSATVTYSQCTAIPDPASCSGYVVEASTAANFTGTVFSSATTDRTVTQLSILGLSANTSYAVRVGRLNQLGAPTYGGPASFNTGTSLVAPVSPLFDLISTGTVRFNWGQGTNPSGLTYLAYASTASNFSGTLLSQTGTALNATFAGLTADTSYYFRVQAVGGPFLISGPTATLALAPNVSTTPFVAVGTTGLTAAWADPGNQPDTLYRADLSLTPDFATVAKTAAVRTTAAAFTGLTPNTLYYARAQAISRSATPTAETALGSTSTLVLAPTAPLVSAVGLNGFGFGWSSLNPAGTRYFVRVSTDPAFSVLAASATTTSLSASFAGLFSNQLYYVSVAGLNQFGVPSAYVGTSTSTLVATPLAAPVAVSTRNATSVGVSWLGGTLAPGTQYNAQVSSSPAFSFALTSSVTANAFALFTGLQTNTTYWARVQAVAANPPTPSGSFLAVGAASTLARPPTAAPQAFLMVAYTSVTVAWTPLAASPSSMTAEGYRVELSTSPAFLTVAGSSDVPAGFSQATVTGLGVSTTFYARVASLNWEGEPDYFWVAGSTRTGLPALSSGTMLGGALTLVVPPASPEISTITVVIPAGTFPPGTVVSAVTSVGRSVAGAKSNEAATLTPFGPQEAFDISAGGLQPLGPVRVTIAYDPALIPPGEDERRLHLWRYDPASDQWTIVPSQTNPAAHELVASIQHFSSFAPFFVTAGADLGAVRVFPQPWEVGDPSSRYWAGQLSFTGLPGGARVRVFTLTGEEVAGGDASAGGVFTWDGKNRFGRRAASGTYYALIESGGARLVRRLVVIR